jgi:hypothetical protein
LPSNRVNQTFYQGTFSSPDAFNSATLYKPGELGSRFDVTGKSYQLVQLDSGAVAATAAGAVAAGQLAFWKDRTNYIVTNDKPQAEFGPTIAKAINSYAGVFQVAGTAGNYVMVQQRGPSTNPVLTSSGSAVAGDMLIVLSTGGPAGALVVTSGTALVSQPIGKATAATATGATATMLGAWEVVAVP